MTYYGYIEAVHVAAAQLGVQEYIGNQIGPVNISGWDFVHFFGDDAGAVIEVGLYEHLHDLNNLQPPLATFYLILCTNGCYRLPTKKEEEWLHGITTVSA